MPRRRGPPRRGVTAESELGKFIAKFAPDIQARIRACRAKLQAHFPEAVQLVYDNYNFLVIGFGPIRRPSEAIFSLAADRNGIGLCFLQRGAELRDPEHLLRGRGKVVRSVPLRSAEDSTCRRSVRWSTQRSPLRRCRWMPASARS
jgi:hypothetical protein